MTPGELWLRARAERVPPGLMAAMLESVNLAHAAVPEALAEGAIGLYAAVARGPGDRGDALPLLAADALFTHAFEAQAELDPEGMQRLVEHCERRLGEIVP